MTCLRRGWTYTTAPLKRLLTVHRVDPNSRGRTCGRFISDRPVLWMMLDSVAGTVCRLEGDSDFDISPNEDDPAVLEPVFRFLMRTIDLLVRHGARSTLADLRWLRARRPGR